MIAVARSWVWFHGVNNCSVLQVNAEGMALFRFMNWPVRRQLLFLAVLLTLPAVGMIIYSGVKDQRQAFNKAAVETGKLVYGIASEQSIIAATSKQLASVVAQLPEVKSGNAGRTEAILRKISNSNPLFLNIAILDRNGLCVASAIPSLRGISLAKRRFFQNAAATHQFSSGESSIEVFSERPTLTMGYPFSLEKGAFGGVVAMTVDLDHFVNHLKHSLLPKGANYVVVDHKGVIISRGADSGQVPGKPIKPGLLEQMQRGPEMDTIVFVRFGDAGRRITSYQKLTLEGETLPYLYIRAGVSYDDAMALPNQELATNLLVLMLFVVLAFFLTVTIGKNCIANRVSMLTSAARDLANGNTGVRVFEHVKGGELGDLGRAFDDMAQQLAAREDELSLQATILEQEVAEHQRAEESLLLERNNLKAIFESAPIGMALLDGDARVLFANRVMMNNDELGAGEQPVEPGLCDVLRCSNRTAGGEPGRAAPCAACASCALRDAILRTFLTGASVHDEEILLDISWNGHTGPAWLQCSSEPVLLQGQQAIVIAIDDITEKKKAEEWVLAEKEQLAVTLRSIGDGVITTDTDGNVVLMNAVAEKLCGWTNAEAAGRSLDEVFVIMDESSRLSLPNPLATVMTERAAELVGQTMLVSRDGTERVIADTTAPIFDREGKTIGVVLVFRDMTERKEIEEELFRARNLESIGILAGGIAHDFNNYLTAILGNISLAKLHALPGDHLHVTLDNAEKASCRARDLTQQLLTFSKGGAPVIKVASIQQIITDSAGFVLRGSNVRCAYSFADGLWPVKVDSGQMSQVMNNLIINADHAMPDGGSILISAFNETVSPSNVLGLRGGRYVKIVIEDHGNGIPEADLPRIFDPYFTTKQHGTGLGLATVYSIITNHHGAVRVHSTVGEGTTFALYVPASEAEESPSSREADALPRGSGRILVMDDEDFIREIAAEMLTALGYQPVTVGDGVEACERYRAALESGEPFDAVIMDVTIPGGVGGKEAIAILREMDPQVCALVSSGYATDPVMSQYASYGFMATLAKPYTITEMGSVLKTLIPG